MYAEFVRFGLDGVFRRWCALMLNYVFYSYVWMWMQLHYMMILFFGELALMDYCMTTIYYPLMAAASVVYATRCTLR